MRKIFIGIIFILLMTIIVSAHPGRTDKYGGHTDKSTGIYHYHLDDGTIVQGEKPSESKETSTKPAENTEETKTIIVDNKEKKLQDDVVIKEKDISTESEQEITIKETENGTRIIYITKPSPLYSFSLWLLAFIITFSIIGIAMISYLICKLIKKAEETKWYNVLYIIYTVFWLPSLLGAIIAKLILKLNPNDTRKEYELFYDDEEM